MLVVGPASRYTVRRRSGRASGPRAPATELLDDLAGGVVAGGAEALAGVEAQPIGVALVDGGGPQRPGGVVDLGVGGGRVAMLDDETIGDRPCRASAERPRERRHREALVGERRPV